MKKKTFALYDTNTCYMERLQRYLREKGNIPFNVCAFTDEDKLAEYIDREEVEFILSSEDKDMTRFSNIQTVYIYEDGQKDGIFRLSPGNVVVERLKYLIGEKEFKQVVETSESKVKFIGVYSPVARSMKTSFCFVLGQMLAKRKNRVLYLNFESFSGMTVSESVRPKSTLSDLMYYFGNLRDDFRAKFSQSIINHNGLDMVSPAFYYLDLSYVTPERWNDFLSELEAMNEYDYIILDLSEYLQGLFDSFLTRCSIVYTLSGNDRVAQNKMFHYEQVLNEYNYENILDKTRKFTIPSIRNLPGEIDRLIYSELAEYVKRETARDFNW